MALQQQVLISLMVFTSTDHTNWAEKDSKKFYLPLKVKVTFFGYSPSELPRFENLYLSGWWRISYYYVYCKRYN